VINRSAVVLPNVVIAMLMEGTAERRILFGIELVAVCGKIEINNCRITRGLKSIGDQKLVSEPV
jgi:hypothetical protein